MTFIETGMWLGAVVGVFWNAVAARSLGLGVFIVFLAAFGGAVLAAAIKAGWLMKMQQRVGGLKCHGCGKFTGIKIETVRGADHLSCPYCWLTLKSRNGPVK